MTRRGRTFLLLLPLPLVLLAWSSLLATTSIHAERQLLQLRGRSSALWRHDSEVSNVLALGGHDDQPKTNKHIRELQADAEDGTSTNIDNGVNETATDGEDSVEGSESESESFLDKLKEGATSVKDEVTAILNSNPSGWTAGQIAGVAIGAFVAVLVLFTCLACCCVNKCRSKAAAAGGGNINNNKSTGGTKGEQTYSIQRPYVTRSAGSAVDANRNLPLGVQLHGAVKLRSSGLTGRGIRVAVIDSGIDKDHAGFDGMVKKQKWYRSGTPLSEDDHGTHVAGTVHFMAPDAELYDYRVFGDSGDVDGDNAIAKSIRQACSDGCHVINMSLRVSYPIVPAVRSAVKFASSRGVHMVCAAGNSGDGDPLTNELYSYPARWEETMSVAAVKKADDLPVANFSESNPQVDYAGIGVAVTSLKPGGGFQTMQGTSMAAPHVTGLIAALLTDKGGTFSDKELRGELANKYAIDIGVEGLDTSTGVGFVTYLSKEEFNKFWTAPEAQSLATAAFRAQAY